jgi:F0F1-type ATP synthase epsilon subunit
MSDEPPDDYFEAAAGVIEAARELDEARAAHKADQEAVLKSFKRQSEAEKKLSAAIERLKGAGTGRTKGGKV